jgi:hypothetical protein
MKEELRIKKEELRIKRYLVFNKNDYLNTSNNLKYSTSFL